MTWFKVDDQLAFHPKIVAAGNTAMGLWARAGSWSAANLTDGRIPRQMVTSLDARKRDAQRLVEAGLWVAAGPGSDHARHPFAKFSPESCQNPAKIEPEGCVSECPLCVGVSGYQFVGWSEYQPTKAQVERDREATRARVDRHRNGRRNGVTPGVTNGGGTPAPSRPVPKELVSSRARAREDQDPTNNYDTHNFKITDEMRQWARENAPGINLDTETERFLDYNRARGSEFSDWTAVWRNWMTRAIEYAANGNGHHPQPEQREPTRAERKAAEKAKWEQEQQRARDYFAAEAAREAAAAAQAQR